MTAGCWLAAGGWAATQNHMEVADAGILADYGSTFVAELARKQESGGNSSIRVRGVII